MCSPFICQYSRHLFVLLFSGAIAAAQSDYQKFEYRIPMRDGVKLFTIVYAPKDSDEKYPILLTRTPYGIGPYGPAAYAKTIGPSLKFERDKFIFVSQDVRGRFESEGEFVDVRPIKDKLTGPTDTDETTDAYDTIDWLVRNVANNNGRVGIYGISYDGFYAAQALVRSHPALVAASPQAPMADLYKGDDAFHNGAFFLIANFSFYADFYKQHNPTDVENNPEFDYGTADGYKFFLQMGSLADSDRKYLHHSNPYWTDMYVHTTYDEFWKVRNILPYLESVQQAVMVVGGWYDAEDLAGTFKTHQAISGSQIVMGPWAHGEWVEKTGEYFRENIEYPFFRKYLKGDDGVSLPAATMFETGKNVWNTFAQWPPADAKTTRLYFHSEHRLSSDPPGEDGAFDSYVSDPGKPVPFFDGPTLTMNRAYMSADQRFVFKRPDVLHYISEPLAEDMTIAGPIAPTLFVSTSGTDSDFDVKVIDVSPEGEQRLVRGEPFRGKFRKSFEAPEPFQPGLVEKIQFAMPDVYHCFLKGHRIMVEVQSSWFPLTDRNPQTFTDIPNAKAKDFVRATERVYHSRSSASFIEVNRRSEAR